MEGAAAEPHSAQAPGFDDAMTRDYTRGTGEIVCWPLVIGQDGSIIFGAGGIREAGEAPSAEDGF
jgi:hypothetical protein